MRVTYDILVPGSNLKLKGGFLGLSSIVLVSAGRHRILVDTGHAVTRPMLRAALAERGLEPGSIDTVFLTHSHFDHVGNVDLFAHARFLMTARERAYAAEPHAQDDFVPAWIAGWLDRAPVETLEGEPEIAPGVRALAAPGHTPGSAALLLATEDRGRVVVAGDAVKYPKEAIAERCDLAFDTPAAGARTIGRLLGLADRIVPGHFPEMVRMGNGRFGWEDGAAFDLVVR